MATRNRMSKKRAPVEADRVTQEMREIGARFLAHRDARGITNQAFRDILGGDITVDGVRKIFSGASCGKFSDLARWARRLGTTPNEILGFEGDFGVLSRVEVAAYAALVAVGSPQERARKIAALVIEAAQAPPPQSEAVDILTATRLHSEIEVRRFLATEDGKTQPKHNRST